MSTGGHIHWNQLDVSARHGTAEQGQSSDGTGDDGNLAAYNAAGDLTDSGIAVSSVGTQPFVFGFYLAGVPSANYTITFPIPADISPAFPANFANSVGFCDTNPTSTVSVLVKDNGTTIATISISTGGAVTFTTVGGVGGTVTAGHKVQVVFPASPDATFAGLSVVFRWSR
jgi:hypothetical protein